MRRMSGEPLEPVLHISRSQIQGILDAVRTIILEWSLKLEKDGILGQGMTFTQEEKKKAADVIYNVNNFYGNVTGTQIQQETVESAQGITTNIDVGKLKWIVNSIKNNLEQFSLSQEHKNIIQKNISNIEDELAKSKPDILTVRGCLEVFKKILVNVTSNIIASGIIHEIGRLL
jgi:hypothetical protein